MELVVLDVNDNAPIFVEPKVTVRLDEDTAVGTFVTTLQAIDADAKNAPSMAVNKASRGVSNQRRFINRFSSIVSK